MWNFNKENATKREVVLFAEKNDDLSSAKIKDFQVGSSACPHFDE